MTTLRVLVPLMPALLAAGSVGADQIYRWVDASGKVTFYSTPPPEGKQASVVDLPPPPSPESIEAQRERERAIADLGSELQQRRLDREAQQAEELRAARERAATQPPPPAAFQEPPDYFYGSGWNGGWIRPRPPRPPRPPWHERPVPPPDQDHRNPDHPAFWPREPLPSPLPSPLPRGR
jgi:hypothetical protein